MASAVVVVWMPPRLVTAAAVRGVAVAVDAHDAVDECCQHWHAVVLHGRGRP
jgi:hypothetical protein